MELCTICNGEQEVEEVCGECDDGQIVEDCEYCWSGYLEEQEECSECGGQGEVQDGETWETCEDCDGSREVTLEEVECTECDATGETGMDCYECDGQGYHMVPCSCMEEEASE